MKLRTNTSGGRRFETCAQTDERTDGRRDQQSDTLSFEDTAFVKI
jgi:hypothetical protein